MKRSWALPDFSSRTPSTPDDDDQTNPLGLEERLRPFAEHVTIPTVDSILASTNPEICRVVGEENVSSQDCEAQDLQTEPPKPLSHHQQLLQRQQQQQRKLQEARREQSVADYDYDAPGRALCRICREDHQQGIISPCNCRGTMQMVHKECLEHWLAQAGRDFCELCGHQYTIVRSPRYGVLASVALWIRQEAHCDLIFDAIALSFILPVVLTTTYLGLSAHRCMESSDDSRAVYTIGIVSIMATIDFICSAWLAARIQHHLAAWYSWYNRNCVVRLVVSQDDSQTENDKEKKNKMS